MKGYQGSWGIALAELYCRCFWGTSPSFQTWVRILALPGYTCYFHISKWFWIEIGRKWFFTFTVHLGEHLAWLLYFSETQWTFPVCKPVVYFFFFYFGYSLALKYFKWGWTVTSAGGQSLRVNKHKHSGQNFLLISTLSSVFFFDNISPIKGAPVLTCSSKCNT